MKLENYKELKATVCEMNKTNDEIALIEWNHDDGPKFKNVQEMKEFYDRLKNNELDYLFSDDLNNVPDTKDLIIESFEYTLEDLFFYIYTFQNTSTNKYVTYMSIKNLKENETLHNLCGNAATDIETAHTYFESLKVSITSNTIDDILQNLLVSAKNTLKKLKEKLNKLTSES